MMGRWDKISVFLCIWNLLRLKSPFKLLEYCSVHISEFMMQELGLCTKCELFICKTFLCKYVLANVFGSLYFAIVLKMLMVLL